MDTRSGELPAHWKAAECPFSVDYLPKVLDDVRLAVVDAFFSLPRGGAEIGGVLLGRRESGRTLITDSVALDCEHAFGPSFTLSPHDLAKLEELIAAAKKNPASQPVGWYHSHTRSEIFLSDADLEIHRRYFPEPWQVALVLKPHTFNPTRAGFFFQEPGGAIHSAASYQEFVLEPLPMRPAPSGASPSFGGAPVEPETARDRSAIDVSFQPEPESAGPPAPARPEPEPVERPRREVPPPAFLESPPPERSWRWIGLLAVALGAGLAVGAYQTRDRWLPPASAGRAAAPAPPASLNLTTLDRNGQLQISWNGNAPQILPGTGGMLTIVDGGEPRNIQLDAAHLRTGSFTYARQGDRVDIVLTVIEPDGSKLTQPATFLGQLPIAAGNSQLQQERDGLAAENERLKVEVARETERARRLEKALADLRIVRQRELQRKRLENQAPDAGK